MPRALFPKPVNKFSYQQCRAPPHFTVSVRKYLLYLYLNIVGILEKLEISKWCCGMAGIENIEI